MYIPSGEWVTILKLNREIFRSLRFRIFISILITGILPIILLEIILMNVSENTVISTRMKNVSAQFNVFSNYLSTQELEYSDDTFAQLVDEIATLYTARIQVIDRDFNIITDTYNINKGKLCISQDVNKCFNGTNLSYVDKTNQCIILVQAVNDSNGVIRYCLFTTSSIADVFTAMSSIHLVGIAIIVILIIILLFFAIFWSGRLVNPFTKINAVIARIDQGHMEEDINLKGCTEVETISNSFNIMLGRINRLEESRQEFVSNVSHELKTPLTSMKVLSDSLLMSEDIPAEMYREFMSDLSNEIDRENLIISDLLTLVKMDGNASQLNITKVNINDLLSQLLKVVKPLAETKSIDLVFESYRPIEADVDQIKLSMAISNLVENAIKYNNNEGWVHVTLNADQSYFYVKVQDSGFGIPKESQDRIFDRFYRVDKARSRDTGGTGLGLAITKSIILAHNGEIKLFSEEGNGTTFSIQIPLKYIAS